MDQYDASCYGASKLITHAYSTSFGLSIRLFEPSLRPHIYAVYGLVRIADEIVDTYAGSDQRELLDALEKETKRAIITGYSTNPIVHAFTLTAREYSIGSSLITPFFKSMRMDLSPQTYDQKKYETYIYGSAEVVGLMCLKVFLKDEKRYKELEAPARRLGAAYQKVNFLRDIAADANGLGRWYFPISSAEKFDEKSKNAIINDIKKDFASAKPAIDALPVSSRKAVQLSYEYYGGLLEKIKLTPAVQLMKRRIRVSTPKKVALLIKTSLKRNSHA